MPATAVRPHTTWPVAVTLGIAGSLLVGVVLLAFLWPAKTSSAHDLPIGVAGPRAAVTALEGVLEDQAPGTFDMITAGDRDAAIEQIKTRRTYGAVVLGEAGTAPEVITAPAGSAVATQVLTGVADGLQTQLSQQAAAAGEDPSGVMVQVTPVVPLSADDPTGTGLAAASFPLTLGGMLGGVVISFLVVGPLRRLAALAGFGVAVGLVLSLVLHTWWHYLQGSFWLNATATGLSVLGISAFIVGCTALLGTRGIAVGAVLALFVGNPLSAATTPWQFIVEPWGAIGQYLVPGAASWLIRSLSYFPDTDLTQQWLTLSAWVTLGVLMTVAGHRRNLAEARVPASTLEHSGN